MKNATFSILLFAAAAGSVVAGVWHSPRETATAAPLRARTILYYVDPMHPAYTSDQPGTAPDCGMALEPVYADAPSSHHDSATSRARPASVNVSPEQQRLAGVQVADVGRTSGGYTVRLFGRVAAEETRVYQVNMGVDGYIREASAATTGSRVDKGQWLATFSAPEVRQPVQAYIVTLDVLDRAQKNAETPAQISLATASVQQTSDRLLTIGMSPLQLEDIRHTRLVPPSVKITAPAAGFVIARNATTGQQIKGGTELFRIADLRRVWIHVDAPGVDADAVRAGIEAEVVVSGRAKPIRARVTDVLPRFDPSSQSLEIRLEADNPDYVLRPDMFVDVELRLPAAPAITVPREAVVQTGLETFVFLERGVGRFEARRVQTGWRSRDRIEIARGLEPGDRVVVSGTFLLDSARRMRRDQPAPGGEP